MSETHSFASQLRGPTQTIKAGEFLIREGEPGKTLFWLVKGVVSVFRLAGGQELALGRIEAPDILGEMSFLDKQPRCATVRAETDCEFVEIANQKMDGVFAEQPAWFRYLILVLVARLRNANLQVKT